MLTQSLPERTAGPLRPNTAGVEWKTVWSDGQRASGRRGFAHRRHGDPGVRIAVDEIEDAVAAGVHAGSHGGPGYWALRRNRRAETPEVTGLSQPVQIW